MRSSSVALIFLLLASTAFAQTATGRVGSGLPTGAAIGSGGTLPAPGAIANISPQTGSVDQPLTVALSFGSANAVTFYVRFEAVNPPSAQVVLNNASTYSPPNLLNSTTYYWQACAVNPVGTTCSAVLTFTTVAAAGGSAPTNLIGLPADGSIGLSITPTLTCAADNADTYSLLVGTTNPPTGAHSLGATCSYAAGTLSYSTIYYVKFTATNAFGSTSSSVQAFTTRADPGATSFCTRPCYRDLLTAAKITEIQTRRTNNTTEWQALVNYVALMNANAGTKTTLTSTLGAGGAGTTFSVASCASLPVSPTTFQAVIDLELVTMTCSGTTGTIASRANVAYAETFGVASHASGADLWWYTALSDGGAYSGPTWALMNVAGESGTAVKARFALASLMMLYGYPSVNGGHNLNFVHSPSLIGMGYLYDWLRGHGDLDANEISNYAPVIAEIARWHMDNLKECQGSAAQPPCQARAAMEQGAFSANITNGQLRTSLGMAAAVSGDAAGADSTWNDAYSYYDTYLIPSLATGPLSGGNEPEGVEYAAEVWGQTPAILDTVHSAIGEDAWGRTAGWDLRFAKYLLYQQQPGGRDNHALATTAGTITAGATALTVTDASSFAAGDNIYVYLDSVNAFGEGHALTVDASTVTDVAPAGITPTAADVGCQLYIAPLGPGTGMDYGYYTITAIVGGKWRLNRSPGAVNATTIYWQLPFANFVTVVMSVSGTTITTRDPAPCHGTGGTVGHMQVGFAYGDVETYNNFDDYSMAVEAGIGANAALDQLRVTNPTYAGYIKYYIDHGVNFGYAALWQKFFYYDGTVTAVDYTGAGIPTIYSTAQSASASGSTGMIIGMSAWTKTATWVNFLVGAEIAGGFDHATHYSNSINFKRKGVWLLSNIHGYGATNLHAPQPHLGDAGYLYTPSPSPFIGWRYSNTVAMNGHGTALLQGLYVATGPAVLSRSDVQATYFYGCGNAGDVYRFGGNDARVYQRCVLYVKPDLVFWDDYLTYAVASASPTTWMYTFAGDPSFAAPRFTSTYSTQKITLDVIQPTSPSVVEINNAVAEDVFLKGYREEISSGATTAAESGCFVGQLMDSGDTPATVTTLTTTNACVVEVSSASTSCPSGCVFAHVTGQTPTLPISWTYSAAAPDSYLFGLAPSTSYHITRATKTVTIVAATGAGDTTSSASGKLAVP